MTHQPKQTKPAARRRPTLVVGLGGTGHRVVLQLKSLIWQNWSLEQSQDRIKFLVFDTAHEELAVTHNGQKVVVERGHEFYDIGQTPVGKIKRNLERQAAIQARLGGIMASLPPTVLRNGAKQLRPLGLLALLWRYIDIEAALRDAIWSLAGRQHNERREGVNVFIANSLVGGTGSSAFLDVAYIIRDLFDELGTLADFCYITGVGLLPRAFHGVQGPNLIPNAVASLKELNHCMMRGGFNVRYLNGRVVRTEQPPFNMYYLVDGVDEGGHTWRGLTEVCRLAAEAIFLQMGSQVGQKHENDFDNLDDVLIRQTEEGDGTFYGSFGLASLHFPARAVAQACAARQACQVIEQGLLADPPNALPQQVEELIEAAAFGPAHLSERLASDDEGLPLAVELHTPGWASQLSPTDLPAEMVRYVRDYEQARLGTDFKRWLTQNETRLANEAGQMVTRRLTRLARQAGLPSAEAFLQQLLARLNRTIDQLNARQLERDSQQVALTQELGHLETVFLQAGESHFFGRKRRVNQAQHTYLTTAQNLFSLRWESQITAAILTIYNHISRLAQDSLTACQTTSARLQVAHRTMQQQAEAYQEAPGLAGVTTQSLAKPELVETLFVRYAPPVADTLAVLFDADSSPLDWHAVSPNEVGQTLLVACQPPFNAVAALSVAAVIQLQAEEIPPESYRTWLANQATPSWNLDRTRLPEGGATLQQLEVLGVPDEGHPLYRQQIKNLVSTGDPTRITIFKVHIGAPHTAIQQWDSYHTAYEQARGHVPLHILPQFQVDNERARQTFALGSLFQFIKTQGAYFYYHPADTLAPQVKLGQGLANSLDTFINKDGLVQETRERVEKEVAARGVEATLRHLSRYYDTTNGRTTTDTLVLELKRLVRAYAEELSQIHQFNPGSNAGDDQGTGDDDTAPRFPTGG